VKKRGKIRKSDVMDEMNEQKQLLLEVPYSTLLMSTFFVKHGVLVPQVAANGTKEHSSSPEETEVKTNSLDNPNRRSTETLPQESGNHSKIKESLELTFATPTSPAKKRGSFIRSSNTNASNNGTKGNKRKSGL